MLIMANVSEGMLAQKLTNELRNAVLPVTVLFGLEILFGTVGNLLTIIVFLFRYKSCNFRYFVLCLAMTDLISCWTTIPGEMVSQIFWYTYPVPTVCKIKAFFNQFTVCSEAACLTVIAIDRYRKVCKPFGWQIKQRVAVYLCIGIYIGAAILATPTPIFWGVNKQVMNHKRRDITVTVCEKDHNFVHTKFPLANIAFNQSLVFLSLICMFVLYVMVVRRLITDRKELQELKYKRPEDTDLRVPDYTSAESDTGGSSSDLTTERYYSRPSLPSEMKQKITHGGTNTATESKRKRTKDAFARMTKVRRKTMIMFYLTVIFILTTILYGALLSIVANGILPTLSDSQKVVYFFFLRLYFINHVINPVLYGIMDRQFRLEMKRLKARILDICSCCCRK